MYVKHFILVYIHSYIDSTAISSLIDELRPIELSPTGCAIIEACARAVHAVVAAVRNQRVSPTRSGASSTSSAARSAPSSALAGECTPAARRLRDRRSASKSSSICPASTPDAVRVVVKGERRADRRRESRPRRAQRRVELSSRRARLRPLRARASGSTRAVRRANGARARCVDGELRDRRCRRSRERRGRIASSDRRSTSAPSRHDRMNILFIGDIVGRPGRELVRQGLAALVEHHAIDLVIANAENAAAGFGITREIGEQLLDCGRRRDDVGQSHLGQEGSARLHRHRAAPAAAGQLSRRRAGQRQLSRADARRREPSASST